MRLDGHNILPVDHIPPFAVIGNKYHVSWARKKAMVWRLDKIIGNKCVLKTKSNRKITTNISDLREINKRVIRNAKNRIEKKNK